MWLNVVRYGIPLVLVVAGIVFAVVDHDGTGAETWAMFTGAGVSVLLLNVLYRMGVEGDRDRDREQRAREHFDEHGRWPD
jgi:O-antigen/teichoic acid export membrane protein